MQTLLFNIKVITNLHAGSGDAGFGIVDKLVQRDAATNLPTIFASGIKGALREYFNVSLNKSYISEVFGADDNGTGGAQSGLYRFLAADILAIPVPADASPYYRLVTDLEYLQGLEQKYIKLDNSFNISNTFSNEPEPFKSACKELPVIARNHLESGQSKNLWYEEVVPHQTEFITALQVPTENNSVDDFIRSLDNNIVQIGGNATVGYGLCLFTKIN